MAAAAAACAPSCSSGFRFTKNATKFATKARTAAAAAPQRSAVKTYATTAKDPLSEKERAELDLLHHADAIKLVRRRSIAPGTEMVDEDGEALLPEALRVLQQKEEFWVGQESNYQKWYAPKKYGNVMSEFAGEVSEGLTPSRRRGAKRNPRSLSQRNQSPSNARGPSAALFFWHFFLATEKKAKCRRHHICPPLNSHSATSNWSGSSSLSLFLPSMHSPFEINSLSLLSIPPFPSPPPNQ
jgi:hypothetical protein